MNAPEMCRDCGGSHVDPAACPPDAMTTCNTCEIEPMQPDSPAGQCAACEADARAFTHPTHCQQCHIFPRVDVTPGGARHLCQQCLDRARIAFTRPAR